MKDTRRVAAPHHQPEVGWIAGRQCKLSVHPPGAPRRIQRMDDEDPGMKAHRRLLAEQAHDELDRARAGGMQKWNVGLEAARIESGMRRLLVQLARKHKG